MFRAVRRTWMRFDPFGVEVLSGACALAWGVYAFLAATPLADLPAYDPLTEFVPADAWMVVASVLGAAQLAAALWGAHWCRLPAVFLLMIWWKILCVSLLNSSAPGPAAMVYCLVALANAAAFVRLCR